jgi:transposase
MLVQLDGLSTQIKEFEQRLEELVEVIPAMQWLETMPGVGIILSATIALEVGDIERFLSAERLASYSGRGCIPVVIARATGAPGRM